MSLGGCSIPLLILNILVPLYRKYPTKTFAVRDYPSSLIQLLTSTAELLRSYLEFGQSCPPLPPAIHFHTVLGEYVFDFAVVIFGVSVDILLSYTSRHPNSAALVFFREKALTCTLQSHLQQFYFHYPRKLYTKKCKTMEPIAKSANALRRYSSHWRSYTYT